MKQTVIKVLLSALILTLGFAIGIFARLYVDQDFISIFFRKERIDMIQGFLMMLIWIPFFMIVPSILCVKRAEKSIITWGILGFFFSYIFYFICLSERFFKKNRKSSRYHAPNQLPMNGVLRKIGTILVYIFIVCIILCIFGFVLWSVLKTTDKIALSPGKKGGINTEQLIIILGGPALLALIAFFCGTLMKKK